MSLFGIGTQKVEEFLEQAFPEANISRIDTDTVKGSRFLTSQLKKFAKKEIDILIGTQMISKVLDFEDVTLVGVINPDAGLYLPDCRAGERGFQLIYQAAGREGLHKKTGEVVSWGTLPQAIDNENNQLHNSSKNIIDISSFRLSSKLRFSVKIKFLI